MVKFVINCMLNIQTQRLFNVKLVSQYRSYRDLALEFREIGHFFSVVGQRKGPSGANASPVHCIKECLELG
jgi:hypothetical protein